MNAAQNSPDIVGLGLSTVDVLIRLCDMPTWDKGTPFSDFSLQGGGMVSTAMVAASRLGAKAGYIGTVGSDDTGSQKLSWMKNEGVDISHAVAHGGAEQSIVVCYVNEKTGDRLFSWKNWAFRADLEVQQLDRSYISGARILHLDGMYGKAAQCAAQWVKDAGGQVMLDAGATNGPVRQEMRELVGLVDYLICGSGFAQSLTGCSDLQQALIAALRLGPSVAIQTEGAQGSYCALPDDYFHTPVFPVDVVDTTGAGDVFHGAFCVATLKNWSIKNRIIFSTAVSALKCTRLGGRAGIPRLDETFAFLKSRNITPFWE
jgi:sulfofructose kinase